MEKSLASSEFATSAQRTKAGLYILFNVLSSSSIIMGESMLNYSSKAFTSITLASPEISSSAGRLSCASRIFVALAHNRTCLRPTYLATKSRQSCLRTQTGTMRRDSGWSQYQYGWAVTSIPCSILLVVDSRPSGPTLRRNIFHSTLYLWGQLASDLLPKFQTLDPTPI